MLYIAADHAGFHAKEKLKHILTSQRIAVKDLGAFNYKKDDDYPDFARLLARAVARDKKHRGILICGSGQGMCIVANKTKGVRAAQVWNEKSAFFARHDDNANVICLAARLHSLPSMRRMVMTWLKTPFAGLARYKRRIKKIE